MDRLILRYSWDSKMEQFDNIKNTDDDRREIELVRISETEKNVFATSGSSTVSKETILPLREMQQISSIKRPSGAQRRRMKREKIKLLSLMTEVLTKTGTTHQCPPLPVTQVQVVAPIENISAPGSEFIKQKDAVLETERISPEDNILEQSRKEIVTVDLETEEGEFRKNRTEVYQPIEIKLEPETSFLRVIERNSFKGGGMTYVELDQLRVIIMNEIHKIISGPLPRFGYVRLVDGVIKTDCLDEFTRDWLSSQISRISQLLGGHSLKVTDPSQRKKYIRAGTWIFGRPEEPETILRLIKNQNPNLDVSSWEVIHSDKKNETLGDQKGYKLELAIPEESVVNVETLGYKICFGFGQISLKLMGSIYHGVKIE